MYTIEDENRLQDIYEQCIQDLKGIGYNPDALYICFNTKLSKTHGKYYEDDKHIEISYRMFISNPEEIIYEIILHELAHNIDQNLNGKCSEELDGHGESWKKIIEDINVKLDTNINRYSNASSGVINRIDKYNHLLKCNHCGYIQSCKSRQKVYEKIRKQNCRQCGFKDWTYLGIGKKYFNSQRKDLVIQLEDDNIYMRELSILSI